MSRQVRRARAAARSSASIAALVFVVFAAAPALAQQPDQPAPAAAPVPSPTPAPAPAFDRARFDEFLAGVRTEALARGISADTVARALTNVEPVPQVLERDRQQAEFTLNLADYLKRRLTPSTVKTARRHLHANRALTARVAKMYGVDPRTQVAVWGLESNFGQFSGVRPGVPTLATLAFDDRRAGLFRGELFDALTIVDQGDVPLEQLRGSWAGALGQAQFLPSSYLSWAVDFDGDKRRDIWTSLPDVFASIANYLRGHGWKAGVAWGYHVTMPAAPAAALLAVPLRTSGCRAVRELSEPRTLKQWRSLGLVAAKGSTLPSRSLNASLLRIDKRAWLVTENYEAILAYNCAHTYALSVVSLADRLAHP